MICLYYITWYFRYFSKFCTVNNLQTEAWVVVQRIEFRHSPLLHVLPTPSPLFTLFRFMFMFKKSALVLFLEVLCNSVYKLTRRSVRRCQTLFFKIKTKHSLKNTVMTSTQVCEKKKKSLRSSTFGLTCSELQLVEHVCLVVKNTLILLMI